VHATTHAEQNPMQITSAFDQGEAMGGALHRGWKGCTSLSRRTSLA
jgi:hypothetical protein